MTKFYSHTHHKTYSQQLISVVIRTRNRHESLCQAIESVIVQQFNQVEIIVVNDGGYAVDDYVSHYLKTQLNIRMVKMGYDFEHHICNYTCEQNKEQDNGKNRIKKQGNLPSRSLVFITIQGDGNRSRAANAGWRSAHGSFLLFLDDDDLIKNYHLKGLMSAMESNPWSGVTFSGYIMQSAGKSCIGEIKQVTLSALSKENLFPFHCALVRKVALEAIDGFDETIEIFEDWDIWLSMALKGFSFTPVNQWSAIYRVHDNGTIYSNPFGSEQDINGRYRVVLKHEADIQKMLNLKDKSSKLIIMLRIILFKIAKTIL